MYSVNPTPTLLRTSDSGLPPDSTFNNGPLSFLPLHAAGTYTPNGGLGSRLSDFAVSSYIPSLAILAKCQEPRISKPKLLTVALPIESALGHAGDEVQLVQRITSSNTMIHQLLETDATVENVKEAMAKCSFVHFACHGLQDSNQPLQSAMLLANDTKLTLAEITRLKLPHAQFAFLSACQTPTGDKKYPEEAMHLAAGMLVAGYQGVIATMWSIQDSDGPSVTQEFYKYLWKDGKPDVTQAAYALHYAVEKLRKESTLFVQWVPFIHMGV